MFEQIAILIYTQFSSFGNITFDFITPCDIRILIVCSEQLLDLEHYDFLNSFTLFIHFDYHIVLNCIAQLFFIMYFIRVFCFLYFIRKWCVCVWE